MKVKSVVRIRKRGIRRKHGLLVFAVLLMSLHSFPSRAEYGDIILNRSSGKDGMRPVIFPHWFHRIRFRCSVCHVQIGFKMRAGGDDITMLGIVNGKYCGACHNNKIAWGPVHCNLCHSGLPGLKTGVEGGDATEGPGIW